MGNALDAPGRLGNSASAKSDSDISQLKSRRVSIACGKCNVGGLSTNAYRATHRIICGNPSGEEPADGSGHTQVVIKARNDITAPAITPQRFRTRDAEEGGGEPTSQW